MLRAYRLMEKLLIGESCSLRVQRNHHERGLGCRVIRMEQKAFDCRREALRLAAVIESEKQRRIEAVASLRSKWTWPCCSMLWDEHHAFGLPAEAPDSCKSFGPWKENGDTVPAPPCAARSQEDWRCQPAPLTTSPSDWDFWDGGDGGDDGPCIWPCPSSPLVGSRFSLLGVPVSLPSPHAASPCPSLGLSRRPPDLCEPAPSPPCACGFRPSSLAWGTRAHSACIGLRSAREPMHRDHYSGAGPSDEMWWWPHWP